MHREAARAHDPRGGGEDAYSRVLHHHINTVAKTH